MSDEAVVVFTVEGLDTVRRQRGTQYWKLNVDRANKIAFVVLVQNRGKSDSKHEEWESATADQPHGTAFLIGRISDIDRSTQPDRWLIRISEYAIINVPDVWKGWRFPVRYMRLSKLRIDPRRLTFQPMPGVSANRTAVPTNSLSIAEAKRALAATFGLKESAVEITIRG
jgi:hypothetical protein